MGYTKNVSKACSVLGVADSRVCPNTNVLSARATSKP